MGQHDFSITQEDAISGMEIMQQINAALQALISLSSGATAPSTTYAYQLWADTANDLLKQRNAANDAWIIKGSLSGIYWGLAALAAANDFTASQQLHGDALLWRFKDTGASGVEWAIRSDGGNLEICENTGSEGSPTWKVRQIIKRQGTDIYALAAGTDTYTASMPATVTEYIQGMKVLIKFANPNATTAPTLNLDLVGVKKIFKDGGSVLVIGDIPAGHHGILSYDVTLDTGSGGWLLLNPKVRAVATGLMIVADEKASGTNGGTPSVGVNVRTLNIVRANTISGASLAGNQITLPAGTYRIRASAPGAMAHYHQIALHNESDGTYPIIGTPEFNNQSGAYAQTRSELVGRITIAAEKIFELHHYFSSAYANLGLGCAANSGWVEVYAQIEIEKEG